MYYHNSTNTTRFNSTDYKLLVIILTNQSYEHGLFVVILSPTCLERNNNHIWTKIRCSVIIVFAWKGILPIDASIKIQWTQY